MVMQSSRRGPHTRDSLPRLMQPSWHKVAFAFRACTQSAATIRSPESRTSLPTTNEPPVNRSAAPHVLARPTTLTSLFIAFGLLVSACGGAAQSGRLPRIAFVENFTKVYLRSNDGKVHFVTDGDGVVWTPDHKFLVIDRKKNVNPPSSELWLVTPDGVLRRQITFIYPDQVRFYAAGSRDHRPFIAYDSDKRGIQIVNMEGSGGRRIQAEAFVAELAVSASGSRIAFITQNRGAPTSLTAGLYIANSDGSGQARLVIGNTPYRNLSCPTFSPDGEWIALGLHVNKGGYNFEDSVWLVHPDGTGLHKLTDGFSPIWSPDGSWIAYVSESRGHASLLKIHPDGTGRSLIMHFDANFDVGCVGEDQPTW